MSEMPQKQTGRSIVAVLAGLIVGAALSIGTDAVFHAARVFPPLGQPMSDALLLLATVYRTIYSVAGAYITARLAPRLPLQHALALGAIGFVICAAGALVAWNRPEFGPHWYPIALTALAVPQCWLGAKLFILRSSASTARGATVREL